MRVRRLLASLDAPDRYGLLLLMILAAVLLSGLVSTQPWGQVAITALLGSLLLFALRTSRASARLTRAALLLVAAALGLALLAATSGTALTPTGAGRAAIVALLAALPVVIGRRLLAFPEVNAATVSGALCIYLILGLLFASVFALEADVAHVPFFASQSTATGIDYLYFSYITLTTVGYGDLVPRGSLARMLAVTEALTGQLYLVTVVAVVVGRFHRRDRPG